MGRRMQRPLVPIMLLVVCSAACATLEQRSTDPRLVEAQRAFDEGTRLKEAGKYAEALALVAQARELREAVLGETDPKVADCLDLLGEVHFALADYAHAKQVWVRALEIREATLGEYHPDVATSINNLAVLHAAQGQYARAEPLYERALKIFEAALGESHPDVASSINNLASLYVAQGQYARAGPLYERALKIRETTLGENHSQVSISLNNLAFLYDSQGQYARAEPLYERALKINEVTLGENHPDLGNSLNNLASLYVAQGQYARAEPLYERALKIAEATLGENHLDVASSVNNLAGLYFSQGQYARAEPLYERALKIREATLGESHPDVGNSLNNLASLYVAQGQYARAEPLHDRALKISETAFGENHPDVGNSLNNLASLYAAQGQYARAEPLHERALKIAEAALSENHPQVAASLNHLARIHLAQQQVDVALPLLQRALTSSEEHLRQEVFGLSEKRLASVLHLHRANEERLYVAARAYPDNTRILSLALSSVLLRKGRSVQEIANTSHTIYRSLTHSERGTFEQLRALRTQLATLSLAGPGTLSPSDYQQRLKDLAAKDDALEAALAKRSEPVRRLLSLPPPVQIVSQVTAALPGDSALVEFVAYQERPLISKPSLSLDERDEPVRYLALMLFPGGSIRAVDLGLAEPIDLAALRLHQALAGKAVSYLPEAHALYKQVFRPLLPYLGKSRRLFLAPDSQLNLVPFAALHDGRRFLVDSFDITYVTSGKELLPRPESSSSARSVVVLADPHFIAPAAAPALGAQVTSEPTERSASLEQFFSSFRSQGLDVPWQPLPGTRKEAQAIQRLFPQAQVLVGAEATKQALLRLTTPGLLHIATHGFFLEDAPSPSGARAVNSFGAAGAGPQAVPEDPLLRSGLVLAGARPQGVPLGAHRPEDSLVTALELAGLNLWGTQLVVLSACDTGRGEVKRGEGVYGLRRALLVAGAETVVTSLWKVNDEVTRQLMEGYYHRLVSGHGRTRALREAMRELRRKYPHPHDWAAFTALGSDAPLRVREAPGVASTE
jgi:tetratricopeptide (TPR) repeat protein